MNWTNGPMLPFDSETTGVDVETDRIVTASVINIPGTTGNFRGVPTTESYLINPGVEIPEAASEVHGISTEYAATHGKPPPEVLDLIAADLALAVRRGIPIVGMNMPFDLTILDRDCRRHGVPTVTERLDGAPLAPVIDVRVLDKFVDPYRKGSRKLTDLCEHYNVRIDGAHDASFDAIAAARVAWRIAQQYPEVGTMPLSELHAHQIDWHADQAASLERYFRRIGKDDPEVDRAWPIRPANEQRQIEV
ncbi:3'-5' exonuclease [Phytoactinopolyspora limicola]|uniref:3'-5' exonuclease n=1 Tax=Phytoactinopolyspora limicola TaxID=2715536 RepID=UPI0014099289|nr:3'-5' exonuclease [Phytoactinopolyspora limicola]